MKKIVAIMLLLVSTGSFAMDQRPFKKRKLSEWLNPSAKKKVSFAPVLEQVVPIAPEDIWSEARRQARKSYGFTAKDGLNQLKEVLEYWLDRIELDQAVGQRIASEAGFAIYDQRALVFYIRNVLKKKKYSPNLQSQFDHFAKYLKALHPLIQKYNVLEEGEGESGSDIEEGEVSPVAQALKEKLETLIRFVDKYIRIVETEDVARK